MTQPANRLINEKSPYLLQHAHNPVDWYPWGEEAFERAGRDDKPVFLSIGYSTCHWCHVMERESFEDEATARLLNEAFVCIKVDREERPDLDQYYMAVCQALTGSGGWPLTIVMTPDKKPFFAGTYFSKSRRWGRDGLQELIPRLREFWTADRAEALRSADEIAAAVLAEPEQQTGDGKMTSAVFNEAFGWLEAAFDGANGGFGAAPKFPTPHNISFLLRFWRKTGRERALAMAEQTLSAMRRGGIYDQLGYGFHRYSTDARWLVPHFEKMLYDQALLACVYTDAFLATGKDAYRHTALETLDYVLRDLTAPEGGFYSAEDADSEGEEGKFYVWTAEEMRSVLGEKDGDFAVTTFGVKPEGNFADPGRLPDGYNILHLARSNIDETGPRPEHNREKAVDPAKPVETAAWKRSEEAPSLLRSDGESREMRLETVREMLFLARERRIHPFKDTKILADWNGLMIGALATAARITNNRRYVQAAEKAARFILHEMRDARGRLFHCYSDGEARIPGFLDDYAFLAGGLIELYGATFDPRYLEEALALTDIAVSLFWDGEKGGLFFAMPDPEIPYRKKEIYDGALPSGNSVMLSNLLRLARTTGRPDLEEKASALAAAFAGEITGYPWAHTAFLCALDFAIGPSHEVVVVGRRNDSGTRELINALNKLWLPNAVVLFKPSDEASPRITDLAPFTKDMIEVNGRPAAYVCSNGRCLKPVTAANELVQVLSQVPSDPPSR